MAETHYQEAQAAFAEHQFESALEAYNAGLQAPNLDNQELVERLSAGVSQCNEALESQTAARADAEAKYKEGVAAFEQKDFSTAEEAYQAALALETHDDELTARLEDALRQVQAGQSSTAAAREQPC